ncbi:MAG TPA: ATP-binding cassette domain-containing protein [bacterium]|nr:ATP-binding cassette domain-containing protein [bacterium]HPJ72487.1 ATP-binding cassette domain-containing protein [bacterium]HPQ65299.1 ATP-binding cassette domain-containing protein [bacterium]
MVAQAGAPNIIELEDVRLERNRTVILSSLSWAIARGEHWALLGANGAGKTSLLKVVTGYEWPTRGRVSVLGREFGRCDLRRLRRLIGWVSHSLETRLRGADTALETVLSGLEATLGVYRAFSAAEVGRARAVLGEVGCAGLEQRPVGHLSQGERQRVLVARALVAEPLLLVLDEPCAGLDPAAREFFLEDLRRILRGGSAPTLLLVTHHVEEIVPEINRVLILRAGTILAAGSPDETLAAPILEEAFGRPFRVEREGGRYRLAGAGT